MNYINETNGKVSRCFIALWSLGEVFDRNFFCLVALRVWCKCAVPTWQSWLRTETELCMRCSVHKREDFVQLEYGMVNIS